MGRKRKRRKSKNKFIIYSTLRIMPVALIAAGCGYFIYSNVKGDFNHLSYDDIVGFLKNDTAIEEETDIEVEDEVTVDDVVIDEVETEVEDNTNEEEEVVTIPYPEIVEIDDKERTVNELPMGELEGINWEETFNSLNDINPDANGWLYIPGTKINLPLVQGGDNDYYLHHDIYNKDDGDGTLFIDWRNNSLDNAMSDLSDVTCIYGHNMASGRMFGPLKNFKSQAFYEKHPYGIIVSENGDIYKLDFFAGVVVDGSEDANIYASDFIDEGSYQAYFDNIINNSLFTSDCQVEFGDKVIALSTCSYEHNNYRFVLYGRLSKVLILDDVASNEMTSVGLHKRFC